VQSQPGFQLADGDPTSAEKVLLQPAEHWDFMGFCGISPIKSLKPHT
jgi:hypothetical protein